MMDCNSEWFRKDFVAGEREWSKPECLAPGLDEFDPRQCFVNKMTVVEVVEGHLPLICRSATESEPLERVLHPPLERRQRRIQPRVEQTVQPHPVGGCQNHMPPRPGHASHLLHGQLWLLELGRASCRERV